MVSHLHEPLFIYSSIKRHVKGRLEEGGGQITRGREAVSVCALHLLFPKYLLLHKCSRLFREYVDALTEMLSKSDAEEAKSALTEVSSQYEL